VTAARPHLHPSGISYLESRAIKRPTMIDYIRRIEEFVSFCRGRHLDWHDAGELDNLLVLRLDQLYFSGSSAFEGTHLVAAIKYFITEVSRLGLNGLPRSMRALKGWSLAAPSLQKLPMPLEVMGAILGYMIFMRLPEMALHIFINFVSYLRPGECNELTVDQIIPPQPVIGTASSSWALLLHPMEQGIPGKTGVFDDTVMLDSEPWISPFLFALIAGRRPKERVWHHSYDNLLIVFQKALEVMGLLMLGSTMYSLRHGGASFDLLNRRRSALEVKRRGRWTSESSLKRYGKEARLQHEISKVNPVILAFGQRVLNLLPELLSNPLLLPPHPW
jgi:hypothetical protein